MACLDEDLTSNDVIGETKIAVSKFCSGTKEWHPIYFEGKQTGELLIEAKFIAQVESSQPDYKM